ncbi:MAG: hypothetical protein CSA22_05130 [Deltaproteobacteria bacterium]|nr:MAG: hypothetical protein CSA22_05130 [Deltaproteobacteria bacterium]
MIPIQKHNLLFLLIFIFLLTIASLTACHSGSTSSNGSRIEPSFFSADLGPGTDSRDLTFGNGEPEIDAGAQDDEAKTEIEEADIIRLDGDRLYLVNQYRGLIICSIAEPEAPFILGRFPLVCGEPFEMYLYENDAYIITQPAPMMVDTESGTTADTSQATLWRIDISNPAAPSQVANAMFSGSVTESRRVDDRLYVVATDGAYDRSTGVYSSKTHVTVFRLNGGSGNLPQLDTASFDGNTNVIHVTETALFTVSNDYTSPGNEARSTYIDIADPSGSMSKKGSIRVAGYLADKYKIDYTAPYLRICTYDSRNEISLLTVVDYSDPMTPRQLGQIRIAQGEQLFATRFDGNRAYMVTFERIDPLWVIDLSDPENPSIAGELEVPGWSTHIEASGSRLIALGVENTDIGRQVVISLFDVSDPSDPKLADRIRFGNNDGWVDSEGFRDPKALTVDTDAGLILLPYAVYPHGTAPIDNRLQLIDYSLDALTKRGWISHTGTILRSRSAAGYLYALSTESLQVIDATNRDHPEMAGEVTLAENLRGFHPLANGYGVRTLAYSDGTFRLSAVSLSEPETLIPGSALELDRTPSTLWRQGNKLGMFFSAFDALPYTETILSPDRNPLRSAILYVDYTDPSHPEKGTPKAVGGQYYTSSDDTGMQYLSTYVQTAISLGDATLALVSSSDGMYRYMDATASDDSTDDSDSTESIGNSTLIFMNVSDIGNLKVTDKIRLSTPLIRPFAEGKTLYYSYSESADNDAMGRSQVQYYLGGYDASDPADPKPIDAINLPGICLGFIDDTVVLTADYAWGDTLNDTPKYNICSVDITDVPEVIDTVKVSQPVYGFILTDRRLILNPGGYYLWGPYFEHSGYTLQLVNLEDPADLVIQDFSFEDANGYAYVTGASGTDMVAVSSGYARLYDMTDINAVRLVDRFYTPHNWAAPAFQGGTIYVATGYSGLWISE